MAEEYDAAVDAIEAAEAEVPSEPPAPNSVYVGNLPWGVTDEELEAHMSECGPVATVNIMRYNDRRSKGCATVQFVNVEDARMAIERLTDTELGGRKLFVREDREGPGGAPRGRGRRGRGGGGGRGDRRAGGDGGARAAGSRSSADPMLPPGEPGTALFVGNLSWDTDNDTLSGLFTPFGAVYTNIKTGSGGRSKGYGVVRCSDAAQAAAAIDALNGTELDGRVIEVREDRLA